jgi:gliding motility-associated-like protein
VVVVGEATGLNSTTISNPVASPTTTTTYTVTVTNASGCTGTATTTITVNPAVTATVTPLNATICSGTSTNFSASGGTTYSWSPASGLSSATVSNPVATPTITTTYTVTVTDANGCADTATTTITVDPAPTASVNPSSAAMCAGDNVTLTASGGTIYSWSPASGLSSTSVVNPVASPTATTTYTVYVTNAQGCSDTASVTVTINPPVNAIISPNVASICTGGNVTLTASGGTIYSWTPASGLNSTSISNPVASPTTTTSYTVFVTNASGCSDTAQITVTVGSSLVVSAGADPSICNGNSAQLNANSSGTVYSWSPGTGLSSSTISNPVASPTSTTTYTVYATDANGCSGTDTLTVNVNPLPNASAGSNVSICSGDSTVLTASGGTIYSWTPATGLSTTSGSAVTATPTATTTYTVFVTDANGCSASSSVTVTVNNCAAPMPVISSSSTSVCDGNCINFSDASTGSPTSWSWTFQGGTPPTSTQQNPGTVCFSGAGMDTVTLVVSNSNGSNTAISVITVNPVPVAIAGTSTTITIGSSVTLTAGGGGTYSWAPATGLNCTTCANPVATPTVTTTYTVFVSQGGCTDTATVQIDVIDEHNVFVPQAFSPNGDGQNDVFMIRGAGIKNIHLYVYDRIGEKVFESTDISLGWDGTYKGQPMNTAVFVYHADIFFTDGTTQFLKGDVSLVR